MTGGVSAIDAIPIELSDAEFADIAALVHQTFGIHLTDQKKALVRGRLASLLRSSRIPSFGDYLARVKADPTGQALSALIDRISTNHSFFFREAAHFDLLREKVLPELEAMGRAPESLRLWSSGCAEGEEAYTLAMILHERYGVAATRGGPVVLGTDVSLRALQHAAEGIYPAQRLEDVPERYRRYFERMGPDTYRVSDGLRPIVLFKRLNLMREVYPFRGRFDVVFCRNVMIYFDQPTRAALLAKIHRHLNPGGYLLIGHSETLGRDVSRFRYVRPTVYQA